MERTCGYRNDTFDIIIFKLSSSAMLALSSDELQETLREMSFGIIEDEEVADVAIGTLDTTLKSKLTLGLYDYVFSSEENSATHVNMAQQC
mmetsp:Transcript_18897/g.32267  ORF Transcript_18897/g.32267 Transcript_18897/m.32267 type:complete len:91 (-) Transcript_18897:118-390(-)